VLVYGGGSLGLLHAALLQLRIQADERHRTASPTSTDSDADQDAPSPSTVHVITSQQDLADELSQHGCRISFLQTFARDEAGSWLATFPEASPIDSHVDSVEPIPIPSLLSAVELAAASPPTHILVTVKGERALDRAADEIYAIGKAQMMRQWNHTHVAASNLPIQVFTKTTLPIVCILMNGLGHAEHILQRLEATLAHDADFSPAGAQTAKAAFAARLYLATTTSGAKLEKTYSSDRGSSKQLSLHLRQGGVGMTTVIQNVVDAKRSRWRAVQSEENTDGMVALDGSNSLVSLFRSIGLPTRLAPAASAATILYTKLLINCAVNPLTALHHVRNGALVQEEFTEQIVGIVREAVCVMQKMRVPVDDYPEDYAPSKDPERTDAMWPRNLADHFPISIPSSDEVARALFHVYRTIERTAHNYSSMYADLHPSQPISPATNAAVSSSAVPRSLSTEIGCITGHLLAKAHEVGIAPEQMTFNRQLYGRVREAERGSVT
jgi:ketopantoate reductase